MTIRVIGYRKVIVIIRMRTRIIVVIVVVEEGFEVCINCNLVNDKY